MNRLSVSKTNKLYINGAFPRSESGRVVAVCDPKGNTLARVAQGSRKDLRDAVKAARSAQAGWASRTGYNRGQILYRIAEILEDRSETFIGLIRSTGRSARSAATEVAASIDRLVWHAGWCDKYTQFSGNPNPVSGPFFNLSIPEPTGVVGTVAPLDSPLLATISRIAPPLVTGNSVVLLTDPNQGLVAVALAEVIDVSDVPAGVINVITGYYDELVPWLAHHMGVDTVDLAGADDELAAQAAASAAHSVTRVIMGPTSTEVVDWTSPDEQSPYLIEKFTETKTVWHPLGR